MKTVIKTILHKEQFYPTIGDWGFMPDGNLIIKVSDMSNPDYEFLVGLHELVEAYLCKKAGIDQQDVTNFDIAFECNRKEGNVDEPGNDPQAPYHQQHIYATIVEKDMARALGVNWEEYDKFVNEFNG